MVFLHVASLQKLDMQFLPENAIQKTGQSQIHVHDVRLSHGHPEQMFETLRQDDSLEEYFNVTLTLELWVFQDLAQIP